MENEIFIKIYKVIRSCINRRQLYYAGKYLDLAEEKGFIDQEFKRAIYFNIYLDKQKELEKD